MTVIWEHLPYEFRAPARQRLEHFQQILTALGKEGWELVHADPPTHDTSQGIAVEARMLLFKRPVPAAEPLTEETELRPA